MIDYDRLNMLIFHLLNDLNIVSVITRHENFHGKFSLCAEYLSRSIGQKLECRLQVFTDYSEGHIWGKQSD